MIKIESSTLEGAYQDAASSLECSVTELKIEVVQTPSKGFLGLFKKSAIIVATKDSQKTTQKKEHNNVEKPTQKPAQKVAHTTKKEEKKAESKPQAKKQRKPKQSPKQEESHRILNDTIMPESFVSTQDDEDYDDDVTSYLADYDDEEDQVIKENIKEVAKTIEHEINELFDLACFEIDKIEVSVHDENTLLIEFKGKDAALLIGKEGYRYKALSYMIFNWINTKYEIQLRLEIAEFLKNQEEAVSRYLVNVCENIEKDGKAQTKILDGVLVQIALRELREKYPEKYVVIRSTRDGLKYIIVNDYHTN